MGPFGARRGPLADSGYQSGATHAIPLPAMLVELLAQIPRLDDQPFVFPADMDGAISPTSTRPGSAYADRRDYRMYASMTYDGRSAAGWRDEAPACP